MNRRKTNWIAIVLGASVFCSAAWVLAEDAAAPAAGAAPAPAAEPKPEVKPEAKPAVTAPAPDSVLAKFASIVREWQEIQRKIRAKETKILADKPDTQKKLDAADEKIKAAQDARRGVFREIDPELKAMYERFDVLTAERMSFFPSANQRPVGPRMPHVHTEGEAAPAAAPAAPAAPAAQ